MAIEGHDTFTNNHPQNRFELMVEGVMVYANYRLEQNILTIDYVFAPPELRGTGAASRLMGHIMDIAKTEGYNVQPFCGYARSWLERHNEYHDITDF